MSRSTNVFGKLPQMENEDLNNNTPAKLSKTSKSESHPRTWSPCHAWTLWSLPCWRGLRFTVTMSPTSSYHSPSHSAVTSSSASSELSGRVKIVICPLPCWVAWIGSRELHGFKVFKFFNVKNSRIFRNNLACHCHGVNWCATKSPLQCTSSSCGEGSVWGIQKPQNLLHKPQPKRCDDVW